MIVAALMGHGRREDRRRRHDRRWYDRWRYDGRYDRRPPMALRPAGVAFGLVVAGASPQAPALGLLGFWPAELLLRVAIAGGDRWPPPPPHDVAPAPEPGLPLRAAAADARPAAARGTRRATAGAKRSGPVRRRPAEKFR